MEVFQRRVCEIDTDPFYLEAVPTAIHLIYILSWKVFQNSLSEIKKFIHFLLKYLQVLYVVHIVLVSNQKLVHFLLKRLQPLNVVCKLKNNFYNICGLKKNSFFSYFLHTYISRFSWSRRTRCRSKHLNCGMEKNVLGISFGMIIVIGMEKGKDMDVELHLMMIGMEKEKAARSR